jgi:hypothetical protein
MSELKPAFCERTRCVPRHPQQEIIDLLAVALLRLRVASKRLDDSLATGAESAVAMSGHQSVNASPYSIAGDGP